MQHEETVSCWLRLARSPLQTLVGGQEERGRLEFHAPLCSQLIVLPAAAAPTPCQKCQVPPPHLSSRDTPFTSTIQFRAVFPDIIYGSTPQNMDRGAACCVMMSIPVSSYFHWALSEQAAAERKVDEVIYSLRGYTQVRAGLLLRNRSARR